MPSDSIKKQAAESAYLTPRITEDPPLIRREEGEPVENFMARVRFNAQSVFKTQEGYVQMDRNEDGKISPGEALMAVVREPLHSGLDEQEHARWGRDITRAMNEDKNVFDKESLTKEMSRQVKIRNSNGEFVVGERGILDDDMMDWLDRDKNGKITAAEAEFPQIESMLPGPIGVFTNVKPKIGFSK